MAYGALKSESLFLAIRKEIKTNIA